MSGTNSMAGRKLYICATPVTEATDTAAEFAALVWVQITGVGSHGEAGTKTNILNYDTWDDQFIQKTKGQSDAGSPEIELRRKPTDAGQIALNAAAATNFEYAFKLEGNDTPAPGGTPTILYNVGIVAGPTRPMGRNEDFDLEVFTVGFNRREVKVDPT